jgi:DNA-binding response OmpR family regulator
MKKRPIIYAEDDPDDVFLFMQACRESSPLDIIHFKNGKGVLDYLISAEKDDVLPCVAVLDMNMPLQDGRETLKTIRQLETLQNLPVILFTTSSSETDKAFAARWGAEMITKPLKYNDLILFVRSLSMYC